MGGAGTSVRWKDCDGAWGVKLLPPGKTQGSDGEARSEMSPELARETAAALWPLLSSLPSSAQLRAEEQVLVLIEDGAGPRASLSRFGSVTGVATNASIIAAGGAEATRRRQQPSQCCGRSGGNSRKVFFTCNEGKYSVGRAYRSASAPLLASDSWTLAGAGMVVDRTKRGCMPACR
jgi:hypothetical protein